MRIRCFITPYGTPKEIVQCLRLFALSITLVSCNSKSLAPSGNADKDIVTTEKQTKQFIDALAENGETLFKTNCAVCHALNSADNGSPGLRYAIRDLPSSSYFRAFISNSDSLLKTGEPYTAKIYADVGREQYQHHYGNTLTKGEIIAIQLYIEH